MSVTVRFVEIKGERRAYAEMERIGVDPVAFGIMAPKQFHYNFKVENLTPAQANVIKQEVLSAGGEAAVSRGAASCTVPTTDAILSGTLTQLNILVRKLMVQSFGLKEVAERLAEAIERIRATEFTLKGRTKTWTLGKRTLIMGILNVTPDSFYPGSRFPDAVLAAERAVEMTGEGAEIIDVGGESTRPGAEPVPLEEELKRVVPVVRALAARGIPVSIDTTKARVALEALEAGAEMVNDISAMTADPGMAEVVRKYGPSVVLMHMRGTPRTMQKDVGYRDISGEVFNYLLSRIEYALGSGVEFEKMVVDPGIGFGKSTEGSLELIMRLPELKTLGRPILVGHSRKSFIGNVLGMDAEGRLTGTTAVTGAAVLNGAHIIRVHDVKEGRQAAAMIDALKGAAS